MVRKEIIKKQKMLVKQLKKRLSASFVNKILDIIQENRAREIRREQQERNPGFQWERVSLTTRERSSNIKASEFLQL
jgi:hypothetical protein